MLTFCINSTRAEGYFFSAICLARVTSLLRFASTRAASGEKLLPAGVMGPVGFVKPMVLTISVRLSTMATHLINDQLPSQVMPVLLSGFLSRYVSVIVSSPAVLISV